MTENAPTVWQQLWDNSGRIASIAAALTLLYAVAVWLTGGISPKSQTDMAGLQDRITHIEADKAALYAAIEALKSNINTRLDSMPRPKDFSDWEGHLHDLDGKVDALRQRASDDEYNIRDLTNRISKGAAR